MEKKPPFSLGRFYAVTLKEFIQMRRDRLTFAMMIGIPLIQLTLFGFAINSDPKNLPTAMLIADHGPYGRTLLEAMQNSDYFHFIRLFNTEEEATQALARGKVQFVINIPENFSRTLLRGEHPSILVQADATDPATTSNALNNLERVFQSALTNEPGGSLPNLEPVRPLIDLRIHPMYNPEAISQYNIVPGLIGVVLTMTMVLITTIAITREVESGTMENLLSMPTRPLEVMIGKIIPYILVGYIQIGLILLAARFIFQVPIIGNLFLLLAIALIFIAANLSMGITFSTLAQNQRQAMQMGMFFFLPSILLSGFMFPFRGMPGWAQVAGELFPLTHFLRIIRGIMLKGNGLENVAQEIWPLVLFTVVVLSIGVKRYRKTLD